MPTQEEHVLLCDLSSEQYAGYLGFLQSQRAKQLRSNSRRPDPGQATYAISVFQKLCNHPDILLTGLDRQNKDLQSLVPKVAWSYERSGKMVVLAEAMKCWHAEGHRVLVFVQTPLMSKVIQLWLRQVGYTHLRLGSKTPVRRRLEAVEEFNVSTDCFAMVLTTRIGGGSLNIIGADRVVLFDPDWIPRTDVQHIGQRKDVLVYRLILAGTVEEKIYQRQVSKHHNSEKVMIKLRDAVNDAEPATAENAPLYGNISFADILEVPPSPASFDPRLLALLKDKYRLVFERLDPEDGGDEYRSGSPARDIHAAHRDFYYRNKLLCTRIATRQDLVNAVRAASGKAFRSGVSHRELRAEGGKPGHQQEQQRQPQQQEQQQQQQQPSSCVELVAAGTSKKRRRIWESRTISQNAKKPAQLTVPVSPDAASTCALERGLQSGSTVHDVGQVVQIRKTDMAFCTSPLVELRCYGFLGILRSATSAEVCHAYRRKLLEIVHPLKGGDTAAFLSAAEEAFETLSESRSRKAYDKELALFSSADGLSGTSGVDVTPGPCEVQDLATLVRTEAVR